MELIPYAIFGLLIGSFLNVCIYRVPRRLSVVSPRRSYCPKCERTLASWENIPVISWCLLGAKCRGCKEPISGRYPFVEILSAVAAIASFIHYGLTPEGVVVYAVTATLIAITFIDFDFKIIPDVISLPGMIIGLTLSVVSEFTDIFQAPVTSGLVDSLIGLFAGAGFFLTIFWGYYLLTKKVGLGLGDVKLMGMLGAIFGWRIIAPTIFMGSLIGSVAGIIIMLVNRSGRATEIAFGPWLALGALLYLFTDIALFNFNF